MNPQDPQAQPQALGTEPTPPQQTPAQPPIPQPVEQPQPVVPAPANPSSFTSSPTVPDPNAIQQQQPPQVVPDTLQSVPLTPNAPIPQAAALPVQPQPLTGRLSEKSQKAITRTAVCSMILGGATLVISIVLGLLIAPIIFLNSLFAILYLVLGFTLKKRQW